LGFREAGINRGIVTKHDAGKGRRIEERMERGGVLRYAEQQHSGFLREQGPNAVQAPACLVAMDHQRVGQQRAERVKLALPLARQAIQQRIDLAFAQR
jgi:hypothetical protein